MVITARGLLRQVLMSLVFIAPAAAQQCPPANAEPLPKPFPLSIKAEMVPVSYSNDKSKEQLATLNPAGGGAHHAGLTRSRTAFSVQPTLRFFKLADGRYCAQLAGLEARWRVAEFMVDIVGAYRPGTCPYREVLDHENLHVEVIRRHFATTHKTLSDVMTRMVAEYKPWIVTGPLDQAAKATTAHFLKGAEPILARFQADTGRDNAAIDSPESYRRVTARCADW